MKCQCCYYEFELIALIPIFCKFHEWAKLSVYKSMKIQFKAKLKHKQSVTNYSTAQTDIRCKHVYEYMFHLNLILIVCTEHTINQKKRSQVQAIFIGINLKREKKLPYENAAK